MGDNQSNKSGGGVKYLIVTLIVVVAVLCGGILFVKFAYKRTGGRAPLNRSATVNDFTFEQSVEATISNFKDSYILIPKSDIKNLKITIKYYDSSNNIVCTHTSEVGNVYKSQSYTVSVNHTLSEIFQISTYSYTASGGTVSYFA